MKITGLRQYYVYLMSNRSRTKFLSGITVDLEGFLTDQLGINPLTDREDDYLVYFELFDDVLAAVEREIVINACSVKKKQALAGSFSSKDLPPSLSRIARIYMLQENIV